MKKLITLIILILMGSLVLHSQVPQAMTYKAIAKDDWGVSLPNKAITLRFTILQGGEFGAEVYQEIHSTVTNKFGLMDVQIGKGTPTMGSFAGIDWSTGNYYIKIEMDPKGGSDFRLEDSPHQLLSVPYALHAENVTSITETDPVYTGSQAAGITATDIVNLGNLSGINTGDQDLSSLATQNALEDTANAIRADIPDVSGFITVESDPIFSASDASGIRNVDIANWSTAYSWGNHAGLYRPIGYVPVWTEITGKPTSLDGYGITDAMNTSHPANVITLTNITNWNTAVSWGDHRAQGYLKSFTELDPAVTNNFNFTGAVTNDLLKFNGSKWVKFTPDFALTNHTHSDATTSISGFMSGTDKTKLNGLQNADGSETKVTAGTNVTVTGVGTTDSPYVINSTGGGSSSSHIIGESYGGGIVFYVYDNGQHGLIAATVDQSTGIRWFGGSYTNTMAFANGVGAGKANTAIIIANQGYGDGSTYAARICNEYSVTVDGVTYGDWYLPSKYELNLLYLQKSVVGGFDSNGYYSSSEGSSSYAWGQGFGSGNLISTYKGLAYRVRAVRAF